jgi:hypothetical protein
MAMQRQLVDQQRRDGHDPAQSVALLEKLLGASAGIRGQCSHILAS